GNFGIGGALTASSTVLVNVTALNDPPVNTIPGNQSVNEDTNLIFSAGNGNRISVGDVDDADNHVVGDEQVQVTLSVNHGTVTLGATTGLSFSFGDANGTGTGTGTANATMTFRGTLTNVNTALSLLTYTPTANYTGSDVLTLTTNDLGN